MVATRRGVRVSSASQTNCEQPSDVQATPSTARRTRRAAKQEDSPTHHAPAGASPPSSSMKRCTRASRLHSPEQPCTPVGSVYEGDVSDLESCCSAVSDSKPAVTRNRGRRQSRTRAQEDEEVSEVESCSSAVSALKAGQSSRRSTRRKTMAANVEAEAEDTKVDSVLEAESCGSVVSETQRATRSQRRSTRTRSATKQKPEDSELSEADSCTSSVSKSTKRRSTRTRKQTGPIPPHLDEASDGSLSPARRTRSSRSKAATDVSEPQSCNSEGFESGPSYSISTRRRRGASRSDCELSDMGTPCSTRSRGTPCSSRTGSGNSSRGVRISSQHVKDLSIVLERAAEQVEEETSLNDSTLETTVISEDANRTLVEEEKSQTVEEEEAVSCIDITVEVDAMSTEKGVSVISEEDSNAAPLISEEAGSATAVTVRDQQEEPSTEQKLGDTSDEKMQEIAPSSEPTQPCQSVPVALCDITEMTGDTEEKDEAMEEADADTCSARGDEEAVVENRPCEEQEEEEKMEVSTLNEDDQQVVDCAEVQADDAIEVTSGQQPKITVDSVPEQASEDITVRKTKVISLLESSEDESDEELAGEVSGEGEEEEEEDDRAAERGGLSNQGAAADASVEGLFMIDTRPGQQTNEQYYRERPAEQQEQSEQEDEDEEFVDEEGDDDEDEDANVLFASRNPLLKEMSSRIDPGIKVKQLGGLYINFDGSKSKPASSSQQKLNEKKIQDEVMKKSVIGPDFEKKDAVPPYSESKKALKLKHRAEREKSTGDGWFNMKAPELTQELKGDLQVLKMRGSMDSKRFYKKNDRDGFPKYFQIGTVMDNAADFYHSRIPKKERKRTMVEELLADAEFRHNNKKKYQNIMAEQAAQGTSRRNNKKKKFHKK